MILLTHLTVPVSSVAQPYLGVNSSVVLKATCGEGPIECQPNQAQLLSLEARYCWPWECVTFLEVFLFFLSTSHVQHRGPFQVASDLQLLLLGPLNPSLGSFSLVTLQSSPRPRKPPLLYFCLTLALGGGEGPSLGCFPCSLLLLAGD
jgi:hypothetical protein